MFGLLKKKNPYAQTAKAVYSQTLEHIRKPEFYEEYGVPDSFDGRFDLLLLHLFIAIHAVLETAGECEAKEFNQALFDSTFSDMDQTLREMGIGDMGIPKHMRRMMKAFNGRMYAYEAALAKDDWDDPLTKNLYGTLEDVQPEYIEKMVAYIKQGLVTLNQDAHSKNLFSGIVTYIEP